MKAFKMDTRAESMVKHQLKARGIKDQRVIDAMQKIPREAFIDESLAPYAYEDTPLSIGQGQTISQPYMVALMTEALKLKETDVVYEIGTGSGYQTALLATLSKHVHTIERIESLSAHAKKTLRSLGLNNITYHVSDGNLQLNRMFDKIIVTAAAKKLPASLMHQLNDGGIIVIPIGGWFQTLYQIEKRGDKLHKKALCDVRFVPLLNA